MELWFLIYISLSLFSAAALKLLFTATIKNRKLPPGPPSLPIFGNPLWLTKSFLDLEPLLRRFRAKYGPIITLRVGSRTLIFISDRSLAHKALIQQGSVFSDRLPAMEASRILTSNQHNINSAGYGPLWRLLRRNLMSEILNPTRIKSYAQARRWVLQILVERLGSHVDSGEPAPVMESFHHAMFCLLLFMCFGRRLDESVVRDVQNVLRRLIKSFVWLNVLSFFPKIGRIIFRKRCNGILQMRREQEEVLIPLIRACRDGVKRDANDAHDENSFLFSYVDSLLALELPEGGGRKLTDGEMVTLCSEFLNAGTDTTSTALQWIMANLVKHQEVQEKLAEEIERAVEKEAEEVGEEDLNAMPYLKAVIMEGLRRHPPAHFVLPHAVSEEVMLEGYVIPKGAAINFTVAEMGWDEEVWEEPMAFRPKRFLDEGENKVDITGSREIKMMPFGAGRRICPGLNLAMLHLEYFVANLVREFEWKAVDEKEVDLSEKSEFTVVMKEPLKAKIIRRRRRG